MYLFTGGCVLLLKEYPIAKWVEKRPVGETFDDWGNFSQSHPNIKENDGDARSIYCMSMGPIKWGRGSIRSSMYEVWTVCDADTIEHMVPEGDQNHYYQAFCSKADSFGRVLNYCISSTTILCLQLLFLFVNYSMIQSE